MICENGKHPDNPVVLLGSYKAGDGNRSAITKQEAEEKKQGFLAYQAIQSFQRGGAHSLEAERRKRGL